MGLILLAVALTSCRGQSLLPSERVQGEAPLRAWVISCDRSGEQSLQDGFEVAIGLEGQGVLGGPLDATPGYGAMTVRATDADGRVLQGGAYATEASGPVLRLSLGTEAPPAALRLSGLTVALRTGGGTRAPSLSQLAGREFPMGPVRAMLVDARRLDDGVAIAILISPLHPAPGLQVFGVEDIRLQVGGTSFGAEELLRSVPLDKGQLQATLLHFRGSVADASGTAVRLSVGAVTFSYDRPVDLALPRCG